MKILLTGQTGQIGGELAQSLRSLGEIVFFPRTGMDLSDLDQVRDVIRAIKPDLIVNPAAYTAVDNAESAPALAMLINADAPGVMAQEAQRLGAGLIHYSTDYVFDGAQNKPYDENAATNPLSVYGSTKLAGEQAIAKYCETHWILRTSWIYGVQGNNFMKTIIRLAQERSTLNVICDQFGAPTWARSVSRITREMLGEKGDATANALANIRTTTGLYHLTAGGETTWYEYAMFIADHLHARGVSTKLRGSSAIVPITTAAFASPTKRPQSSRLATNKIESTFKVRIPHWQSDAKKCLDEIIDRFPV
jgi:dTDP-4-dehydrorhamnose reductase